MGRGAQWMWQVDVPLDKRSHRDTMPVQFLASNRDVSQGRANPKPSQLPFPDWGIQRSLVYIVLLLQASFHFRYTAKSMLIQSLLAKGMHNTFAVPICRWNYKTGPKVHVFEFPKDVELSKKWLKAIKRDGYTRNRNSTMSVS